LSPRDAEVALDRRGAAPIPAKNRDRAAVPFGIVLALGRIREDGLLHFPFRRLAICREMSSYGNELMQNQIRVGTLTGTAGSAFHSM